MIHVRIEPSFDAWREAARPLLLARVPPQEVVFDDGSASSSLFAGDLRAVPHAEEARSVRLPKRYVELARHAAHHSDGERWSVLYRVAFRISGGEQRLLDLDTDRDTAALLRLEREVRRDLHHMHAFVRFRLVDGRYVAWYRPEHSIEPLAAPFFRERFASMQWSILTPRISMHWNGTELQFTPGLPRSSAPTDDALETFWRTYYASTFNPARTNLTAMRADMPSRVWSMLPELVEVPRLVAAATQRVGTMVAAQRAAPSAAPFVPRNASLRELSAAARSCEGCELYAPATQTVFGEGPPHASLVLVGEQPGDREDLEGRPFAGPSGELLDRALQLASIDRDSVYVTNAVKHFAFNERGKQRIHRTPKWIEVTACRPWLNAELSLLAPRLIVTLGATATRALLGPNVRVTSELGRIHSTRDGWNVLPTIHPAAILRAQDQHASEELFASLVATLRQAREEMEN